MATTKTTNHIGKAKKGAVTATKKLSKAGRFMRSLPKGEILDMRAVLK